MKILKIDQSDNVRTQRRIDLKIKIVSRFELAEIEKFSKIGSFRPIGQAFIKEDLNRLLI